jgi:hypothetical protein
MTAEKDKGRKASRQGAEPARTIDLEAREVAQPDSTTEVARDEAAQVEARSDGVDVDENSGKETASATASEEQAQPAAAASVSHRSASRGFAGGLTGSIVGGLLALALAGALDMAGVLRHVPLIGSLASPPAGDAASTGEIDALAARLADLEARPDPAAGLGSDLAALERRIAGAEERIGELAQQSSQAAGQPSDSAPAELAALRDQIAAIETRLQAMAPADRAAGDGASESASGELASRLAALEGDAGQLRAAAAEASGRIDTLQARIDAAEAALAERAQGPSAAEIAARSVAVSALQSAYERGEKLSPLLERMAMLAGDNPALAQMRDLDAAGISTNSQLREGFAQAADLFLAEAPQEDGALARLMANARALVKVRPAGPMEGDSPQAVASRIEAALASGDIATALAEWESLPQPAKDASAQWRQAADARVAADRAMRELAASLSAAPAGE